MLRIDPAHPPVWRTPSVLQFGVPAVALIDEPASWELRLVRELERGIAPEALDPLAEAFGAPDHGGDDLVRRIRRALAPVSSAPLLRLSLDAGATTADLVAGALGVAGADVVADAEPVIVVGHHALDPRRVSALMAEDVAHLPLVLTGAGVEIGPFVVPGRTACLTCVGLHRRDADTAWPALASQLLARPAPAPSAPLLLDAALTAVALIRDARRHPRRTAHPSVTVLDGRVHRRMRTHRPHAGCGCRSLAGIATAAAPAVLEPRRPRAYGRPA